MDRSQLFTIRKPAVKAAAAKYGLAVLLFVAGNILMLIGDRYLLRYGFPWGLVSLLIIFAVSTYLGARCAVLVLALSALFGDMIVPGLHTSYFLDQHLPADIRAVRMLLFLLTGATIIWLDHKSHLEIERAQRKKSVLETLQRSTAPDTPAKIEGWDCAYQYHPAREEEGVGGDFCDVFPIGCGRIYCILIGDVVGKGTEAAAHTSFLRYSVRAHASFGVPPGEVLDRVNWLVDVANPEMSTITASLFVGLLDADTGQMHYASAGHEPPILFRTGVDYDELLPTGPVLGVGIHEPYEERRTTLEPGNSLLLFTDGATEARNRHGVFLDQDGLRRLYQASSGARNTDARLAEFTRALINYIGPTNRDDIALLLLSRQTTSANPHHDQPGARTHASLKLPAASM